MLHQPVLKPATPTQVAQRSYRVTYQPQPDWSARRGLDWSVRRYGEGNDWTFAEGMESLHVSEERAHAFGEYWNAHGRMMPDARRFGA